MTSGRRSALIVGVLLIVATAASLVSSSLLGMLGNADFLGDIDASAGQVLAGAVMAMLAAFTSVGIAMALYPVLRPHSPGLALGAVGMRAVEAAMYLVAAMGPILLVTLSREHATAAQPFDETLGTVLKALHDQAGVVGALAFYLGAGMCYVVLYRTRLIPRWLSDWGLLGVAMGFVAGTLVVLGVVDAFSPLMVALNLPILVQELVMAVWLLLRGFDSGATPSWKVDPKEAGHVAV